MAEHRRDGVIVTDVVQENAVKENGDVEIAAKWNAAAMQGHVQAVDERWRDSARQETAWSFETRERYI